MAPLIVGAGLAGLIAACHFKDANIIEAGSGGAQHQALLRFRDTSVSEITGIPFKKVEVAKDVFSDGMLQGRCSIADANSYSLKVAGAITTRSISKLDAVQRYIAPDDFYEQLVDKVGGRINWNCPLTPCALAGLAEGTPVINTAPMSVALGAAGIDHGKTFDFEKSPIRVTRVKLKVATDVYQTIYFPDMDMSVFRASITGDTLIIECLDEKPSCRPFVAWEFDELDLVCKAFGFDVDLLEMESMKDTIQRFGKILDMPKAERQALMYELTSAHSIFSLGRFATWRNILLDDVVKDVRTIDQLINSSAYARRLLLKV